MPTIKEKKITTREILSLDWIKILNEAIKARPTSWFEPNVREWHNASDEIAYSLIKALREKEWCDNPLQEAADKFNSTPNQNSRINRLTKKR